MFTNVCKRLPSDYVGAISANSGMNNCCTIIAIVIFSFYGRAQDLRNTMHPMGLDEYGHGISGTYFLNEQSTVRWNWALFSSSIYTQGWYVHSGRISRRTPRSNIGLQLDWSGESEWSVGSLQLNYRLRISDQLRISLYQRSTFHSGERSVSVSHSWGLGISNKSDSWKGCLWATDWLNYSKTQSWKGDKIGFVAEELYHYPSHWWTGLHLEGLNTSEIRLGIIGEMDYAHWSGRLSIYTDGQLAFFGSFQFKSMAYTIGLSFGWERPVQPLIGIGNNVEG